MVGCKDVRTGPFRQNICLDTVGTFAQLRPRRHSQWQKAPDQDVFPHHDIDQISLADLYPQSILGRSRHPGYNRRSPESVLQVPDMTDVGRLDRMIADQLHRSGLVHKKNTGAGGLLIVGSLDRSGQERTVVGGRVEEEGNSAGKAEVEADCTLVLVWTGIRDSVVGHIVIEFPGGIDHPDIALGRWGYVVCSCFAMPVENKVDFQEEGEKNHLVEGFGTVPDGEETVVAGLSLMLNVGNCHQCGSIWRLFGHYISHHV